MCVFFWTTWMTGNLHQKIRSSLCPPYRRGRGWPCDPQAVKESKRPPVDLCSSKKQLEIYVSLRLACCPGARCRVVFSDRSVTSEHLPTHANNDSPATSNTRLPLFQPSTPSDMLQQTPHFTTSGEGSGCSHTTRSQSAGQQTGKCQGQNFYRLLTQMSEKCFQPSWNNALRAHSFFLLIPPNCRKR